MPISHFSIHTKNIDEIAPFYEAALAPLGYKERMRFHDGAVRGYGASKYDADFWISSKEDSNVPEEFKDQPAGTWGGPVHFAFHCTTRNQVRAFYDAAIATGARCNGPPGLRPQYFFTYYGAFVWDAEGRNVEAVCMRPGFWAEEWGVLGWSGALAVAAAGAGYLWQNYWS
ncbi:hypothetical protein MD484_g4729, partial [Candolleomyces efflorescens]